MTEPVELLQLPKTPLFCAKAAQDVKHSTVHASRLSTI